MSSRTSILASEEPTSHASAAPVGVIDSGVGGLSVLRTLLETLPDEDFIYQSDAANVPYGERSKEQLIERVFDLTEMLRARHRIKALVVACNTATMAAIRALRHAFPDLPVVGTEPGVRPGAALTRTGRIAVVGTRSTLASEQFSCLRAQYANGIDLIVQPCDGLADAIEAADFDAASSLCEMYMRACGPFGNAPNHSDVLVLGCTHYPLVLSVFQKFAGPNVAIVEPSRAIARQTSRLLGTKGLTRGPGPGTLQLFTTGQASALHAAAERWLTPVSPEAQTRAHERATRPFGIGSSQVLDGSENVIRLPKGSTIGMSRPHGFCPMLGRDGP